MKNNNCCLNNRLLLYFQVQDESNTNHSEKDNPNDTICEGRMYERLEVPISPVKSYLKYVSKLHPYNMAFWQQPCDNYLSVVHKDTDRQKQCIYSDGQVIKTFKIMKDIYQSLDSCYFNYRHG